MKRALSRVLTVTAAALACLTGQIAPASATTLPPILYASQDGFAHQCTTLGNDGTVQGVICADIVTEPSGEGAGYLAYAQAEAFCQNMLTKIIVQCANATVDFGLFGPGTTWPLNSHTYSQCGHASGPCAPFEQRNYFKAHVINYTENSNQCSGNGGYETQVQTVVFSEDFNTAIELPASGKMVYLTPTNDNDSPNQVSGHYFVCP